MVAPSKSLAQDSVAVGTSVVAFLIAGVLFMASIVAVLATTRDASDRNVLGESSKAVAFSIQANDLASVLLSSSGFAGSTPFGQGPLDIAPDGSFSQADLVTRLGLLEPGTRMMDFNKFQNLRLAPLNAYPNDGYVNYMEARNGLGLANAGLDFHIRSFPTLRTAEEVIALGQRDSNLRVAYIGDAGAVGNQQEEQAAAPNLSAGLTLSPMTCTVDNALYPRAFHIEATLTNGGEAATQFEGILTLTYTNGHTEYHKINTFMLNHGGASTKLVGDSAYLTGRTCNGLKANLKVYDPERMLLESSTTFSLATLPSSTAARGLLLDTSKEFFRDAENVRFDYSGQNLAKNDRLILTVCPGTTWCQVSDTAGLRVNIEVPASAQQRYVTIPAASLAAGEYTARLYYNPTTSATAAIQNSTVFHATERLLILADAAAAPAAYNPASFPQPVATPGEYDSGNQVSVEVKFLHDLMDKFCPFWYDSTTKSPLTGLSHASRCDFKGSDPHKGDVYPQDKKVLKKALQQRLLDGTGNPTTKWTNILVVGSNVDHNKLTSSDVKNTIGDWVLAGGTLIVFGSSEMHTQWLESVFHVALQEQHGSGISVPDEGHPVLNVPNDLNWPSYKNNYAWRLKVTGNFDAEAAFTRVVNEAGANPNAVLAVSDPGDFGKGNVLLTGWTPWDIFLEGSPSPTAYKEGLGLVHNLLMLGYRDLYLDYGPPLPALANVVPAIRTGQICHPDFDDPLTAGCDNPISLNVLVFVFGS
jgi:hypothetical protein